jgi:hypothetical protein
MAPARPQVGGGFRLLDELRRAFEASPDRAQYEQRAVEAAQEKAAQKKAAQKQAVTRVKAQLAGSAGGLGPPGQHCTRSGKRFRHS